MFRALGEGVRRPRLAGQSPGLVRSRLDYADRLTALDPWELDVVLTPGFGAATATRGLP